MTNFAPYKHSIVRSFGPLMETIDIRKLISYGCTSQNTKWSSAKYLVRKHPDEGTCVPWVQNGDAHYTMFINRECRHFAPREHTCPHREVL